MLRQRCGLLRVGISKSCVSWLTLHLCCVLVSCSSSWDYIPLSLSLSLSHTHTHTQFVEFKGGYIVILETLGTGAHEPQRKNLFYSLLEENKFKFSWFRTDYRFDSVEEAVSLTRFFFGHKVANSISESSTQGNGGDCDKEEGIILPECTGLWWLKV